MTSSRVAIQAILVLFVAIQASPSPAQENSSVTIVNGSNAALRTHNPPVNGSKPDAKPWRDVIGRKVQAQGIAWGAVEKGWGECVIIDGARIFVEGANFLAAKAEGRLVEVTGTLKVRLVRSTAPSQGASGPLELYYLDQPVWRFIERVEWPWLREMTR